MGPSIFPVCVKNSTGNSKLFLQTYSKSRRCMCKRYTYWIWSIWWWFYITGR